MHHRNKAGDDAFVAAASTGSTDYLKFLWRYGFDVNERNRDGFTTLADTCYINGDETLSGPCEEIALFLIAHGADVDAATKSGRTPLMWLAKADVEQEEHALTVARALVSHGAHVGRKNLAGKTAAQTRRQTDYIDWRLTLSRQLNKHRSLSTLRHLPLIHRSFFLVDVQTT